MQTSMQLYRYQQKPVLGANKWKTKMYRPATLEWGNDWRSKISGYIKFRIKKLKNLVNRKNKTFKCIFSAIEMNEKIQCRDLCHALPNCDLWSFFQPNSRAYKGLCHLIAKKGTGEAHDCPYGWTCTMCPRLSSDCV